MHKPIPIEEKFQKAQNAVFSSPKVLLFCLESVPWTSNELVGNNVENSENSQLTPYKSLTSLVVLYQSALKYSWNYER